MAEDKNMLESLVKVEEKFGVGLILRKKISQLSYEERYKEKNEMRDFMKNLFHFFHTNEPNTSIRPLLRYLFNLNQDNDEAQILEVKPLPNFVIESDEA
jgi:hypothetical protein